jgi:hypothetical protein
MHPRRLAHANCLSRMQKQKQKKEMQNLTLKFFCLIAVSLDALSQATSPTLHRRRTRDFAKNKNAIRTGLPPKRP